jgi:hypothetical protein
MISSLLTYVTLSLSLKIYFIIDLWLFLSVYYFWRSYCSFVTLKIKKIQYANSDVDLWQARFIFFAYYLLEMF